MFRDQPETPLQRAIYWTEYVLRYDGAPQMRSASLDLTWYQRNLLDVLTTMFIILQLFALASFLVLRRFFKTHFFSVQKIIDSVKKIQ
jgi:glucuronosyltransferase